MNNYTIRKARVRFIGHHKYNTFMMTEDGKGFYNIRNPTILKYLEWFEYNREKYVRVNLKWNNSIIREINNFINEWRIDHVNPRVVLKNYHAMRIKLYVVELYSNGYTYCCTVYFPSGRMARYTIQG